MRNILITILISFLINGCNREEELTLNNQLIDNFSGEEITFLYSILIFFDSLVIERTSIQNTDSAYHKFMSDLEYEFYDKIENNLSSERSKIDHFINKNKNSQDFNKIFRLEHLMDYHTKIIVAEKYEPNANDKYILILDYVIQKDSSFIEYKQGMFSSGDIPPDIVAGFQAIHTRLNFKNEVIRLLTAIHYITILSYRKNDE